jgi:hypothetical protein
MNIVQTGGGGIFMRDMRAITAVAGVPFQMTQRRNIGIMKRTNLYLMFWDSAFV